MTYLLNPMIPQVELEMHVDLSFFESQLVLLALPSGVVGISEFLIEPV